MFRPTRKASQKARQNQIQIQSDLSEESDGDFSSGSSEEFVPKKGKTYDSDEFFTDSESSPEKNNRISKFRGNRSIATLRGSVGNKFKRKQSGGNLQEILQRAQFQKRKSVLDEIAPEFDCPKGLRLSDSSDSEDDGSQREVLKTSKPTSSSNVTGSTSTSVGIKAVHNNYQQMHKAKAQLSSHKKKLTTSSQKENLDIADLLAIGEGSSTSKNEKSRKTQEDPEDDGWEEVEDDAATYQIPKHGIKIILNGGGETNRKNVKKVDVRRKEYQVNLHKANLLAWVAHGNFVNAKLNNPDLMAGALRLVPKNNHCYPTDKPDVNYFEHITNWFKSTIKLNNINMYCMMKTRPPLMTSLALQLKFKTAICRRDYVLLYVVLLRAMGIQCRMVQSLNCAPIMSPRSDLLSFAKKPEEKAKSSSSRAGKKSVKIPQLDGGDDLPPRKRGIRSKALPGYKVDELDVNLGNTVKPKKTSAGEGQEKAGESSQRTSKRNQGFMASTSVKIALDSPNRFKSPSEKLFKPSSTSKKGEGSKSKENCTKPENDRSKVQTTPSKIPSSSSSSSKVQASPPKSTLQVFSPRRLRSRSRSIEPTQNGDIQKSQKESTQKSGKSPKSKAEKPKDTLQVFSPRRLRSRSRSNEGEASGGPIPGAVASKSGKPSIKNPKRPSTSKQEAKKKKLPGNKSEVAVEAQKKKIKTTSEGFDVDSTTPAKDKSQKKTSFPKVIDRRVDSSDDDDANTSTGAPKLPRNTESIDIWVEVYSEKDEKWLSIDVFNKKINCVPEIRKAASHPMVYVFAWNNDNSLKDVSARYCESLNTVTRKQRVDQNYLMSILNQFAGQKTSRDVKEDDHFKNKYNFDGGVVNYN